MNPADVMAQADADRLAGQFSRARDLYCQVLQHDPQHAEALHSLGILALQGGDAPLAIECLRGAIARRPDTAVYHCNLGEVLRISGKPVEAIPCYQEAIRLCPELAEAHSNLGLACANTGKLDAAKGHLDRAVALKPTLPEAQNNRGLVFYRLRHLEEAEVCFREALKLRPPFAEAENNLANVVRDRGGLSEAIERYRRALRLRPNYAEAANNVGLALMAQGDLTEALASYREALRIQPLFAEAHSNFLFALNYLPGVTPKVMRHTHEEWAAYHAPKLQPDPFVNLPDPERRLRIGYVSPDFRQHAVARFLEPILAHHDPSQVEVHAYADVASPDAITQRLRSLAPIWRSIFALPTEEVVHQVREDQIDILVDLTGHTGSHRLEVFARKPAPIQMTYLGYPNTTGLTAIDYRLTEAVADPPGVEAHYTEQLLRLDGAFCCLTIPPEAPEIGPLPALQRGHLTFGSPHNLAKLNEGVLDLWAAVLRALPDARLLFFRGELTRAAQERLTGQLTSRGISPDRFAFRVVSSATAGYAGYLALYGEVDIVLDAFPANAGTTACESLLMGVPLITLPGDRFYSRLSASLLTSAGLSEGIARSPEDYVALAVRWGRDLPALARLRAGLRNRLLTSPLGNPSALTRSLEAAFRTAWRRWCATQAATE